METQALAELPTVPKADDLKLERITEFHHFQMEPRVRQDLFQDRFLGRVAAHPAERLLIIDPHLLRSERDSNTLMVLLLRLKKAPRLEIRVKAASPRHMGQRGPHDFDSRQQGEMIARLMSIPDLRLEFDTPSSVLEEHDRILLWQIREGSNSKCYRIILGHGLFGFEPTCNRRSEGVLMRIDQKDFDANWLNWRK